MSDAPRLRALQLSLLAILLPAVFCGGCRFLAAEAPVWVVLPDVPAHWRDTLGDPAWRVVVPGMDTGPLIGPGIGALPLRVPKSQNVPVLGYPVAVEGRCVLPPAAAVFPADLAADHCTLALSWERGPAGEILRRLGVQGVDLETLNAPRLCREIEERFAPDPWALDLDRAADALVCGSFRVTDLRALDRREVRLPVGAGWWFLESPFFPTVEVGGEEP
jgi:hypothetical protein